MKIFFFAAFLLCACRLPAQWQPLGAPEGGTVYSLAGTPEAVWAGTASGIFKSTDGAATWSAVSLPLPATYSARKIAARGTIIVAALESSNVYSLAVSTDQGGIWTIATLPIAPTAIVRDLEVGDDRLFLAVNTQLFVSADTGQTWQLDNLSSQTTQPIALQWADGELYATSGAQQWRLPAGGTAWESIPLPAGTLACFFAARTDLWIAAMTGNGATYRSTDQGQNWQPTFWSTSFFNPLRQVLWYDGYLLGLRDGQLVTSTDDGMLWQVINASPLPAATAGHLDELASQGTALVGRHFSGLFRTDEPQEPMTTANNGFSTCGTRTLEVRDGFVYAVFPMKGFYRKAPGSSGAWEFRKNIGPTSTYQEMRRHGAYLFSTSTYNTHFVRIERSDDGWLTTETVLDEAAQLYGPMVSDGPRLFTLRTPGTGFYARRTDDSGDNWENITAPLFTVAGQYPDAMGWQNGVLLAAFPNDLSTFYRSDDNGETWSPQAVSGLSGGSGTSSVTRLAGAGGQFLARVGLSAFFRSADQGQTWLPADDGLPSGTLDFTDLLAVDSVLLLALGNAGVYRSLDGGASWSEYNDGMGQRRVNVLRADSTNVYLGTGVHGVWQRSIADVSSTFTPELVRNRVRAWPNPAFDRFTVEVADWRGLAGRLELYDAWGNCRLEQSMELGQEVKLPDGLASGLYWVRVVTARGEGGGVVIVAPK